MSGRGTCGDREGQSSTGSRLTTFSQIDTGDNSRIKGALQKLCKAYRQGLIVSPDQLTGIVNAVVGTAYQPGIDEKVRRWVLNSIARLAKEQNGVPAVLHLLKKHADEPQTLASGIAAVYKLCIREKPEEVLKGIDFNPQMRTLAALQHVPHEKLDLNELPINVDGASSDILRLALVVVGLGRSPENLLNPRYNDAEMVRVLGGHQDPIVSQYTIWAITENDKLGIANLGMKINDIERHPENVRAWMLQLLAIEANDNHPHWEVIRAGMSDTSAEARRGLALGLRDTFIDIFVPWVLDWISNECDPEAKQNLLGHIVRQADKSRSYEQFAIETYDSEPPGSSLRQSMEANAAGMRIFARFKEIDAGAYDLFNNRSITLVEKQYNIGSVQGAAVNVGEGTATNYGSTSIQVLSDQQVETLQAQLAKLEAELHDSALEPEQKRRALEHVREAKNDPSPGKIGKIVEYIGHLGKVAEAGKALAPYVASLGAALGWPVG